MKGLSDIVFVVLIAHCCVVRATLYLNADSSTVSQGTLAKFNCYNSQLANPNIFNTGGKIEYCRNTQFSSSMQVLAEWTKDNGATIRIDDPLGRFEIEGGLVSSSQLNQYLKIRNTSKTDQGSYYCILYDVSGNEVARSAALVLNVRYPPAEYYPLCTATPRSNGEDIDLLCRSEKTNPPVTLQWYKGNNLIADGRNNAHQTYTQSEYELTPNERNDEFECRLVYNDGAGLEVRRSCRFQKPYIAILHMGGQQANNQEEYHVLAHSSPPFISDINCTLESSTETHLSFEARFPGYGVATVGPVALRDNGTHLVCRAENVLAAGEARMPIYSSDGAGGETTIPSVVTNYMQNEGDLSTSILPSRPVVSVGANVTFGCSTNLVTTLQSSSQARVVISWRYNNQAINPSGNSRFSADGNSLTVSNVTKADDNALVQCVANVGGSNIPTSDSSTTISVIAKSDGRCLPMEINNVGSQTQAQDHPLFQQPSFVIGLSILAAIGWLALIVILIFILLNNRKQKRSRHSDTKMNPQMTYRAGQGTLVNGQARNVENGANPAQRALPAHPTDGCQADPHMNGTVTDTLGKQKPDLRVVIPNGAHGPEMAYQEMVGDTGINKSRHGSIASNITLRAAGQTPNGSLASPGVLVPGPQGGFLPRSLSMTSPGQPNGGDVSYEDLDTIQQRRRLRRATSNDYQTTISNTPWQHEQQEKLLPHYANS